MKPTPTHHLIHWLNTHPNPHKTMPGTSVRLADAHDHLVCLLEEKEAQEEELDEAMSSRSEMEDRLNRLVFRLKSELDRIINLGETSSETADQLEDLLAFVEENQ